MPSHLDSDDFATLDNSGGGAMNSSTPLLPGCFSASGPNGSGASFFEWEWMYGLQQKLDAHEKSMSASIFLSSFGPSTNVNDSL